MGFSAVCWVSTETVMSQEVNHMHWGLTSPESWVPRPDPDAGPERPRKVHTVRCRSIKCELLQVNLSAREGTHSPGEEKAWTRSRTNQRCLSRGPACPRPHVQPGHWRGQPQGPEKQQEARARRRTAGGGATRACRGRFCGTAREQGCPGWPPHPPHCPADIGAPSSSPGLL